MREGNAFFIPINGDDSIKNNILVLVHIMQNLN